MRPRQATLIALVLLFLTGCMKVYDIREGSSATSVPGVPFFAKKEVCKIDVTYVETVWRLTLLRRPPEPTDEKPLVLGTVLLSDAKFRSEEVRDVLQKCAEGNCGNFWKLDDESHALTAMCRVVDKCDADDKTACDVPTDSPSKDITLAARTADTSIVTDGSKVYYFNSKRPWSGSVTASADLAGDGSLSKSSITAEDKTFETALAAIPVTSYLTKALDLEPAKSTETTADTAEAIIKLQSKYPVIADAQARELDRQMKLRMQPRLDIQVVAVPLKHLFTRTRGTGDEPCKTQSPCRKQFDQWSYRLEEIAASGSKESDSSKQQALLIEGKVVLPEPKGDADPDKAK